MKEINNSHSKNTNGATVDKGKARKANNKYYKKTSKIENFLTSVLSEKKLNLMKLVNNSLKNLSGIDQEWNSYQYHRQKFNVSEIDYIPPVFVATIVDSCNLRCPNCFYILENPDKWFNSTLSVKKFEQILKKYNKEMKAKIIFLTGGEPLIHPQFGELVKICRDYKLIPKIASNGILIMNNPSALENLEYANISADSYDYETYNKYRGGTKRQFDRMVEGLNFLKESNLNFSISFVLSRENIFDFEKMIEFAERFKPGLAYFHNINPFGSDKFKPLSGQDEYSMKYIAKAMQRTDYEIDIFTPPIFNEKSSIFTETKCVYPWLYFCFNSKGDVSYCNLMEHDSKIGNVFNNYDFNSPKMLDWRKNIIVGKIEDGCLYCQRRFTDKQKFAFFDSEKRKWLLSNEGNDIVRGLQKIFSDNQPHLHI